jgi:hypothetical protein
MSELRQLVAAVVVLFDDAGLGEFEDAVTKHGGRDTVALLRQSAESDRAVTELRLRSMFDEHQVLDLLMLTGWYHAISFAARAARIPLEPGAPRFTDVVAPASLQRLPCTRRWIHSGPD